MKVDSFKVDELAKSNISRWLSEKLRIATTTQMKKFYDDKTGKLHVSYQ